MPAPVGEMKRLVSLVDRGEVDEYFYPKSADNTLFIPQFKSYHNFTQETLELPYTGAANWGQRITFTLPFPWMGDCLNWVALRITPNHWLPGNAVQGLSQSAPNRWTYPDISNSWVWATNLGSSAIALVEMEVNGIVVEKWGGDWIDIWHRLYMDPSRAGGWADSIVGTLDKNQIAAAKMFANQENTLFFDNPGGEAAPVNFFMNAAGSVRPTEDGSVYSYFPFWFARRRNAAFPLASIQGEGNVRFHITFRNFNDVIRKIVMPRNCGETVLGTDQIVTDRDIDIEYDTAFAISQKAPNFADATLICGFTHLDGELRKAYVHSPHEILTEPVINIPFSEPLKYVVNTGDADTITVSLPLEAANGPIREVIWFLRRKDAYKFNSWTNYGAYLENEWDYIYKPQRSLLKKAVLRVGSVVWADQDEMWWRHRGALQHPGDSLIMKSYLYAYSFAHDPTKFGPTGSMNASRAEMRLDLTIIPPTDVENTEWEVQVFIVGHNWMRFQNGLAERLFTD